MAEKKKKHIGNGNSHVPVHKTPHFIPMAVYPMGFGGYGGSSCPKKGGVTPPPNNGPTDGGATPGSADK